MKKDKRTKSQLLSEIGVLKSKVSLLESINDDIRRSYESDDQCRKFTKREEIMARELIEAKEYRNVFKESLKYILTKAR